MRFTKAVYLGIFLSCIFVLPQMFLLGNLPVSQEPTAIGDVYYMVRYHDGKAELFKNPSDHKLKKLHKHHDVKEVIKTSYAEISALVTQRIFDYQYYFDQYLNTNQNTSPQAWEMALNRLMSVFSKELTLYNSINNEPFSATSWGQLRELFISLMAFFQGWSLQIQPNVRVIPLCNNREAQVYVTCPDIGWSRVTYGDSGVYPFANSLGFLTTTLSYEKDKVWRIKSSTTDDRMALIFAPPYVYSPPPYTPYEEDQRGRCCSESSSSSSSTE